MKKKLLLVIAIVAALTCLFAIGVSAAELDTTKESVTLSDGTVCQLWDTDGKPLIWYIAGTNEDGSTKYAYIDATSSAVDYYASWDNKYNGMSYNAVEKITITVDDKSYTKTDIVVANMRSDDIKITSGAKSSYVGAPVVCITKFFSSASNLEYAYLPNTIIILNGENFRSCNKLKYVNIAELTNLKKIGSQDFYVSECKNLFANQKLDLSGTQLIEVGDGAFCKVAASEIIFPSTLTTVGTWTFQNCTQLTKITFTGTLTSVGNSATFSGCNALVEIVGLKLTSSSIGDNMFNGCKQLKNAGDFLVNGALVLPSNITSLAKSTFTDCKALTSVDLGQIKEANYSGFSGCTSLVEVTIPTTLTSVGTTFFSGCTALKYVSVPSTLTSAGYGMFQNCTSLQFAEVSIVVDKMFNGCTSLKAISIPEGVTKIESMAFCNCTALKAVYLPSTLTQIGTKSGWGEGAFAGSTNLYFVENAFSVKDANGNWLGDSFQMPQKPDLYYMPSGLTTIYGGEFQYCKYMNPTIVFPKTLTSISYANGPFVSTSEKQNMTYIFLGDMEAMGSGMREGRYKNVSFVFANKNDTSLSSIATWSMAEIDKGSSSNFIAYFCASEVSYDMGSLNRSGKSGTYTVNESEFTKTTYIDTAFPHIYLVAKNIAPSCDKEGYNGMVCFCGAYESEENVVPATHDYGKELSYNVWVWENDNYFENANYKHTCQICSEEYIGAVVANSYLFIKEGFATFANKDGETIKSYDFQYSIKVNTDAMDNYTEETGNVIKYGTVAGVGNSLTNPISYENGTLSVGESAAVSDMTGTDYVKLLIKVTSIPVLEEGVEITCNAYAIVDDKLRYVGETTVTENAQFSSIK